MSSEEESFEDFRSNLLDEFDAIELVPENLWTITRPTLYFSLPGIAATFLGYWLLITEDAKIWEYLFLVVGVFFAACGLMFFIVGLTQLLGEKTRYTFTNQGLTIKPQEGDEELITWKEMDSLKIEGQDQGYAKKMKITIRVKRRLIIIPMKGYYEPTSKSRDSKRIMASVQQYYERMK